MRRQGGSQEPGDCRSRGDDVANAQHGLGAGGGQAALGDHGLRQHRQEERPLDALVPLCRAGGRGQSPAQEGADVGCSVLPGGRQDLRQLRRTAAGPGSGRRVHAAAHQVPRGVGAQGGAGQEARARREAGGLVPPRGTDPRFWRQLAGRGMPLMVGFFLGPGNFQMDEMIAACEENGVFLMDGGA
eukprot:scaffold312_cov256-Pinguiococcus_pyrenoidosus.AAC.14